MSKFSFHNITKVGSVLFAYVMDDYGFLVQIHHGRVNHFLAPLH